MELQANMQVEIKRLEGCKRSLEITLPRERADGMYEEILADFRRNLKIAGFRRGKVPENIIRRRFDGEIRQEVIGKLVPDALQEAIRSEKMDPVERPTIEDVRYVVGEPLKVTASFEVAPEIELKTYTGLTVKLEAGPYKITDEQVDAQLEYLRQRAATFKPLAESRPARVGDFALVDLRGEPQAEGAAAFRREGILVAVEEDGAFQGKLVRALPGEKKTFLVTHPSDFDDPVLAGKTVEYSVDVRELKERVLPALDDEFARDMGRFASLEELREEMRRQLADEAGRQRRKDAAEAVLREIAAHNPEFDLPAVLVQRQMAAREHEMRRRMAGRGIDPDHIGFDWQAFRERELPEARRIVREGLLLDAIAEREGISISNKDVQKEIADIAVARGRDPKELQREMMRDGTAGFVKRGLLERAVEEWLLEHNKIKEV